MSMNDLAGLDPFDPQLAQLVDDKREELVDVSQTQLDAFIRRRQQAYKAVFGNINDADVAFVIADLAVFARAYGARFDPDDRKHALLEGRSEVYYRIMDHARLSHDTLYEKYTDAINKRK